ncbi:MAG TPA: DUF2202 domain-containing protein, partial [Thermoleophilia bacterium]|nr:DUF2202 domain-containing protein [Thermoleophilia bacterium]
AIRDLLDRYEVADPAEPDVPGEFTNHDLQGLYDDLVAQGRLSLHDALEVGVAIEELDIEDLGACLQRTNHADIQNVYGNLIDGSYNHLAAFLKVLAR